jgi:hypothetical protein
MTEINKNDYYKRFSKVSVNQMVWSTTSKCCNCNNFQEFSIFVGDGQKLSTLHKSCCSKCLPEVIREAIQVGKDDAEKAIKNAEDRLYKESLEYVRKTKLKKLEDIK